MTSSPLVPAPLTRPYAWDLVSQDYTRDLGPHVSKYAADALALAPPAPHGRVIDVATGPGTLALLAARLGHRVTAVDFSPAMVALLRTRAATDGLDRLLDVRVGDGEALPFDDASFDSAFSIFGLMFFADRARGLSQLRRVTAPGGCAVIGSWAPFESLPAIAALFAALRRAAPDLDIPPVPAHLGEVEEVHRAMRSAGFVSVDVHTVSHDLGFDSPAAFFASFARSAAPVALLRERIGEQRWSAIAETASRDLTVILGAGPLRVPMPARLGIGRCREA